MGRIDARPVSVMRAAVSAVCLLAMLVTVLPAGALAADEPAPAPSDDPQDAERREQERREEERREQERQEQERREHEREERERLEQERLEQERREQERQAELTEMLATAARELDAAEDGLLSALAAHNRAAGDVVVARLDLAEARERREQTERRLLRARRELEQATADLAAASEALATEAAAAYMAGSTTQTPSMVAMEALVRSRSPEEFARGLTYLDAMLADRAEGHQQATRDVRRWTSAYRSGTRAQQRAADELAAAEEELAAAEADAPREEHGLDRALAAHLGRTGELSGSAAAHRTASEEADVDPLTAENVKLTTELTELAAGSARLAERLRAGSERIVAGKDGVSAWQDLRCPVDGRVRFVNDWGFPRSDERSHEGTDVFAEHGTAVVAMADATVVEISRHDAGLGGKTVTYEIDDHRVYNAHLDTVAEDLEVGAEVEAGRRIGTVGTTGNARATPPHNHVGFYRPDDSPVNPYPTLRRSCR